MWQGVELPSIHAAGHHKIACSLWSRFNEDRSFHLYKALSREVVAHHHTHLVAEDKVFTYRRTADIKVAVLHTEVFAPIGIVLNGKRRYFRVVEQGECCNKDFYFPRRDIGINSLTPYDGTLNLNHIFTGEGFGLFKDRFVGTLFIKD